MATSTSVGRGPAHGGNENHDGDPLNKTFGETVKQEPPAGNDLIVEEEERQVPSDRPSEPSKGKGKG